MKYFKIFLLSALSFQLSFHSSLSQAQTDCSIWSSADFYEYAYTLCPDPDSNTFNIDITGTIFHDPRNFDATAPAPFCGGYYPLSPYPAGVYGRDTVTMTIRNTARPDEIVDECIHEHIHSRAATVELVLDKSGSMGSGNKLQAAKTAAEAFIDSIIPLVTVRPGGLLRAQHYGVVLFNEQAEFLDIEPLVPPGDVEYEVPTDFINGKVAQYLQPVSAGGATSIGAGLQLARSAIDTHVQSDNEPYERPAILVLSDGKENRSPWIADELPALQNLGIPVYTIGLGEDYQIDAVKLQNLSNATGGRYRHTNDPDDLSKFFMEVLVDNFANTTMLMDPKGAVTAAEPKQHSFPVSELDKSITVVLTWRNPANNLDLTLKAKPLNITKTSHPATVKIADRNLAYKVYSVPVCQKALRKDCAKPGEWTATISTGLNSTEHYSLTVLSESDAHFNVGLPRGPVHIGEKLPFDAYIMVAGKPVSKASIMANVSAPAINVYHQLAKSKPALKELATLKSLDGQRTLEGKKAVLAFKGKPVPRKKHEFALKTLVPANTKTKAIPRYKHDFTKTTYPGSYNMTFRATWKSPQGHAVMREITRSIHVSATPVEKSKIKVSVVSKNKATGTRALKLDFTPLDTNGELLGTGHADKIHVSVPQMKLAGFKDLGNGTYRLETEIPTDWTSLRLEMAGMVWRVAVPNK